MLGRPGAADGAALLGEFVRGLAELSGCELTQLYLLDATHTCLGMNAECLDGALQPREAASLPADYNGEQLLQFALCQNRVVCLDDLASELDRAHQHQALASVLSSGAQVILTATEAPDDLDGALAPQKRFHVEQGQLHAR